MRKGTKALLGSLAVLAVAASLPSCGGGGGGGGDTNTVPPAPSQSPITKETVNATLSRVAEALPGCTYPATARVAPTLKRTDLALRVARDVSERLRDGRRAGRFAALETETLTLEGNCPGKEGALVLTATKDVGTISGTVSLEEYCTTIDETTGEQAVVNGSLDFSGTLDQEDALTELLASTPDDDPIAIQAPGVSATVSFVASLGLAGDTTTVAVTSLSIKDEDSGEVFGLQGFTLARTTGENTDTVVLDGTLISPQGNMDVQNLTISVTEDPVTLGSTVAINGTIADDKGGAMQLSTTSPLTITAEGDLQSGQMQILGGNNTKIVIAAAGGGVFEVDADTNGDGTMDFTPNNLDCSEFNPDLGGLLGGLGGNSTL